MRFMVSCLAALLVLAGCGGKGSSGGGPGAGGVQAQMTTDPPKLGVGHDSSFSFTLTEGGAPVAGARVFVALGFKGLNKEGPTGFCTEAAPGRYEIRDLSTGMNGRWEAALTVSRANQPDVHLKLPFLVHK
jgi:hypothetical protein